jgi:acetoin utilization deacetylase AcuC-like enzyme
VLNDVAVAIRQLQHERVLRRVLVVDLDVHQGNGTAAIFEHDASVYTLSLHGAKNYPLQKTRSSLDVGLPDGIGDDAYLDALEAALARAYEEFAPELVFYLAGVDVARGDRYGKLALTDDGVRRRDRCVVAAARGRGLPLALVLGGGYAPTKERTAELHSYAFHAAAANAAGAPFTAREGARAPPTP